MHCNFLLGKEQISVCLSAKKIGLLICPKLASKWYLAFRTATFVSALLVELHPVSTWIFKIVLQISSRNICVKV